MITSPENPNFDWLSFRVFVRSLTRALEQLQAGEHTSHADRDLAVVDPDWVSRFLGSVNTLARIGMVGRAPLLTPGDILLQAGPDEWQALPAVHAAKGLLLWANELLSERDTEFDKLIERNITVNVSEAQAAGAKLSALIKDAEQSGKRV